MKKRIYSIILAALMVITQITVLCTPVSAANVCKQIGGNSKSSYSFSINTGSRWIGSDKLTLTQTKGTMSYSNNHLGKSKCDTYGLYTIHVTYKDSMGRIQNSVYTWKGTKTYTLSLKKNTVYAVTVVPYSAKEMGNYLMKNNICVRLNTMGWTSFANFSWTKAATYNCTSTKGILSCGKI